MHSAGHECVGRAREAAGARVQVSGPVAPPPTTSTPPASWAPPTQGLGTRASTCTTAQGPVNCVCPVGGGPSWGSSGRSGRLPLDSTLISDDAWGELARSLNLTPRELQISSGVFNDEVEDTIASDLAISAHTVHAHVRQLFGKLGVIPAPASHARLKRVRRRLTRVDEFQHRRPAFGELPEDQAGRRVMHTSATSSSCSGKRGGPWKAEPPSRPLGDSSGLWRCSLGPGLPSEPGLRDARMQFRRNHSTGKREMFAHWSGRDSRSRPNLAMGQAKAGAVGSVPLVPCTLPLGAEHRGGVKNPHRGPVAALAGTQPLERASTLAVIDPDRTVHDTLHKVVGRLGGHWSLVGYMSAEEALGHLPAHPAVVAIVEVRLPGLSGIDCVRRLKAMMPGLPIVMHSDAAAEEAVVDSLAAGACGYVVKPSRPTELAAAIRAALSGSAHLCPVAARAAVAFVQRVAAAASAELLTERERQVIVLLASHLSRKEIAVRLGIETGTVRTHLRRLYEKLHVHDRRSAVGRLLPPQ